MTTSGSVQKLQAREIDNVDTAAIRIAKSLTPKQVGALFGAVKSFNGQVRASIRDQNPSIFETAPKKVEGGYVQPSKVQLAQIDLRTNASFRAVIKASNPSVFALYQRGLPAISKAKYDLNTEIQKAALARDVRRIQASVGNDGKIVPGVTDLPDVGDIFLRLLSLFRRQYKQVENDSNGLYQKVKKRTDEIELLTNLVAEANLVKGDVDWANNDKLKSMIDYAVNQCGLVWEKGKYAFTEADKAIFIQQCLGCKDTKDRWTKLDQPEMQKYLHWLSELLSMLSNAQKTNHDTKMGVIHNFKT